ncbi:MAG: hypothetical protein KDD45_02520 [Bdellovibrionales bacterium]|nr:hypothetical protein [Bdellovibrionales bacterium]
MRKSLLISLCLCSFIVTSCSSKTKKQETKTPPQEVTQAQSPAKSDQGEVSKKETPTSKELEDLKITIKKAQAVTQKNEETVTPTVTIKPTEEAHHKYVPRPDSVPAEKALGWLKNGNTRFTKGFFRNDGAAKKDVSRLVKGQNPHSIILSCSDSRVPPEVVFDQKLGEVFVIRTAGESLDNAAIASIEYAVDHLGTQLIVVMGHSNCGAVQAALKTPVGGNAGSPYLTALVADLQPRMQSHLKSVHHSEHYLAESWDNTRGATKDLLEKSKIVRDAVKEGHLRIESALYHLDSGKVEWSQ